MCRERANIGTRELARMVNVSPTFICRVENGSRWLSFPLAIEISKALGCSLNELAGIEVKSDAENSVE